MADELLSLIWGYRLSQAIRVVAVLGVADLIAEVPRTASELAAATGSDAGTLQRVLRALAAYEVLAEDDERRFRLTGLGERLRSDVPGSLRAVAIAVLRPSVWDAWGRLDESVRTGANAFRLVHGVDLWEHGAADPEERRVFDAAMAAATRAAAGSVLDAYDFAGAATIVDVGGGRGALLRAILAAYPGAEGVLFDQPHVVEDVDLGPRARIVGGSFFESVPAGGDVYLLKWILHDFEDDPATRILRTIRDTCDANSRLLVIERDSWRSGDDAQRPPYAGGCRWTGTDAGRIRATAALRGLCTLARDPNQRAVDAVRSTTRLAPDAVRLFRGLGAVGPGGQGAVTSRDSIAGRVRIARGGFGVVPTKE